MKRGQLLWTHVPFIDSLPYELVPEARSSATQHTRVLFRLAQRRFSQRPDVSRLPVAALPQYPKESYSVYNAKVRPVLVIGTGGIDVDPDLTRGKGKWQRTRTLLVAPYFGVDRSSQRGGWDPRFAQKIRHAEFSQFFWDRLPVQGAMGSILRLDQLQPIGRHHEAYEYTPYRLSQDAMEVTDQWLEWYLFGRLDPEGILQMAREELPSLT